MVEERKSAGNLNNNSGTAEQDAEGLGDPEYHDLMDLIYSGGIDGQPTVMEEHAEISQVQGSTSLQAQAIPFVTVTESDELEISTEAMEMLDSMQMRKIAVLAFCGTENTGKSFLANRFLGRMQGFKTRGLLGQGTRGIYIWSQPVPMGNEVDGLVLDCQGLSLEGDNVDSDVEEKLFTLAILLASQLVFNTKGHITDQTMDELTILPFLSSKIKIGSGEAKPATGEESKEDEDDEEDLYSDEEGDSAEFYKFFPQFNWVVRDLNMDFQHLTPKTYMMQGLEKSLLKSDQAKNRNEIRRCVKEYFGGEAALNCFALVPPHDDEQKLESLSELQETELKEAFSAKCSEFVTQLKQNCAIKAFGDRHLTGNMLLNLAMEFVDSINQNATVSVLPAFERVVLTESERFSEKLFESIKVKIAKDCSRQRMPFEREELHRMQSRVIKSANQYLSEKLGRIVDCKHLVQIASDVEARIRDYFKDVFKENEAVSRTTTLNFVQQSMESGVTQIKINEVEHIQPHLLSQLKAEYNGVLAHYLQAKTTQSEHLGPYGASAFFDLFQTSILDQTSGLVKDIERVYTEAIEKAKAHLSEYQRQRQMVADLVGTQEGAIERQNEEYQNAKTNLEAYELMLGEAQRKLKEAVDLKKNANDLNDMDLKNMKVNAERLALERMQQAQQLEREKESLQDQAQERQESLYRIQNQRVKDVKNLRQQQQILQDSLEQGKRKLSSNQDFLHVHSLYKKLKVSLDEIKEMEAEKTEIQNNKRQMATLQQEALAKELKHIQEQNLILQQASDREQSTRQRYATEIAQLNKQVDQMEQEVVTMADEIHTHENVLLQQTSRTQNLVSKNQQISEFNNQQQDRVTHQKSLIKTLNISHKDQNELTEKIEVRVYEQTQEKAVIGLSQEGLCDFIEIFNKKLKEQKAASQQKTTWAGFASSLMGLGSSTPKDTIGTQDILVFNELPTEQDKKEVNKSLAPHGIQYQL